LDKFGFAATSEFAVFIDDAPKSLKYKFTAKDYNVENLNQFVSDYMAGKIKPYIKSEPKPATQGPVIVVTGETFNEIIMDPTTDVLFEMYAPWCGHCKKLEPIFNELAEDLKSVSGLTIAKMDSTANDSPHSKYQAKGYPTIMFASANNKENPIAYSGERDVKSFKAFLEKNASAAKFKAAKGEL